MQGEYEAALDRGLWSAIGQTKNDLVKREFDAMDWGALKSSGAPTNTLDGPIDYTERIVGTNLDVGKQLDKIVEKSGIVFGDDGNIDMTKSQAN